MLPFQAVVGVLLFLVSTEEDIVTGQAYVVAGGRGGELASSCLARIGGSPALDKALSACRHLFFVAEHKWRSGNRNINNLFTIKMAKKGLLYEKEFCQYFL